MSHVCDKPIAWDALVDYWAGDLTSAESDGVEEQLFACAGCTKAAERVARIAHTLKGAIPPVVSAEEAAALRARGLRVADNEFLPNVRKEAVFTKDLDVLLHRLRGLDLVNAERVEVAVKVESTGDTIFEEMFAPFDRDRGEVLVACQRHFVAYPPDIVFDVRVHRAKADATVQRFIVPHVNQL